MLPRHITMGLALIVTAGGLAQAQDLRGDLNCDGLVNNGDIDAFVLALTDPSGYAAAYPTCNISMADTNCDGLVNNGDIEGFVAGVSGGSVRSCPGDMALIPAGEYEMGCHTGDCYAEWLPLHNVYLDSFHIGVYEVTAQEYADGLNWALGQGGLIEVRNDVVYKYADTDAYCNLFSAYPRCRIHYSGSSFTVTSGMEAHPITDVSWVGAAAYCNWLSVQNGLAPCYNIETWECNFDADGYRLPTEAEWEYAARGGAHDPYYMYPWGDTLDGSMANCSDSGDPYEGENPETTPVGYYDGGQIPAGSDMANGYGLYDVSGNVREWCHDWYSDSYYSAYAPDGWPPNPIGPADGIYRVTRGGCWWDYAGIRNRMQCAGRFYNSWWGRSSTDGFRVAKPAP